MSDGQQNGQHLDNVAVLKPHHSATEEEVPIKERLLNLEVIVREIRDNMRQTVTLPVQLGQSKPRKEPLELPSPARAQPNPQPRKPVISAIRDSRHVHNDRLHNYPPHMVETQWPYTRVADQDRYPPALTSTGQQYVQYQPYRAPLSPARRHTTLKPLEHTQHTAKHARQPYDMSRSTTSSTETEMKADSRRCSDDQTDRHLIGHALSR